MRLLVTIAATSFISGVPLAAVVLAHAPVCRSPAGFSRCCGIAIQGFVCCPTPKRGVGRVSPSMLSWTDFSGANDFSNRANTLLGKSKTGYDDGHTGFVRGPAEFDG